jgi:putative membrane protein
MNFSEFNKTVRICALICLPFVLWTIIVNGSITIFLHPRSILFVKLSFFILCGLALYNFRKISSPTFDRTLNWKVCVLFLPIALGMYVKPSGLTSRIAVQKGLTSVAMTSRLTVDTSYHQSNLSNASSTSTATGLKELISARTKNACDTLQDDSLYVKLDQIYSNPQKREGEKVAMTGFIAPDTLLGKRSFFIARMMVSCCAADAMPIGFYCVTDTVLGIHEGDWVLLSGCIEAQIVKLPWNKEKQVLPVLRILSAHKTVTPQQQYIYPVAY